MNEPITIITCASWEDRFSEGYARIVSDRAVDSTLVFYFDLFDSWTAEKRAVVREVAQQRGITTAEQQLNSRQPAENWKILQTRIKELVHFNQEVLVDISTMPRELIWVTFWTLESAGAKVRYVYNCPAEYSPEWLSRDPERPRLVFKLSGVARLECKTALILVAGYDRQRATQLMRFFEPEKTCIGLQKGEPFSANAARMDEQRNLFTGHPAVKLFDVDAFGEDRGYTALEAEVKLVQATHNIILSSLGPKLSAVSIYRLQKQYPQVGIAYATSREFNREYSKGLGTEFGGQL
jgi:hypothetical protein